MPDVDTSREDTRIRTVRRRGKLPPKGTAARLRYAVGLWSYLSPEEIEHVRREIYGSRKSSA